MSVYLGWLFALAFGYAVYRLLTIGVGIKPQKPRPNDRSGGWTGHNVHSADTHPPPGDPGPGHGF